jgi:hypothetical protein
VINFWTHWVEAVRFTCEAQIVMSQRLMLLASGGPAAGDEAIRMISEKVEAFGKAYFAASEALAEGFAIGVAAERAFIPLQSCVYANSLRFSRAAALNSHP